MAGAVTVPIFFSNDTATTEIYPLSLHAALPICSTVTISPAADNPVYLNDTHTIENSGTINWISGPIYFDSSSAIVPLTNKSGGVININGGQKFSTTVANRTWVNQGVVNKLGSTTFNTGEYLENSGAIDANEGVFIDNAGGSS